MVATGWTVVVLSVVLVFCMVIGPGWSVVEVVSKGVDISFSVEGVTDAVLVSLGTEAFEDVLVVVST